MANQQRNGRNVAMPDENRPRWRPQDDERRDDERFASRDRERMGAQWDDRSSRWDDREDRSHSTEYYGQGQSGYGAGRYEGDRSFGSRNRGSFGNEDSYRDRGTDERFVGGRGDREWNPHEQSPYLGGGNAGAVGGAPGGGGYLGQSGQEMGYGDNRSDRHDRQMTRPGDQGMYGRGGMQHRYGSQGYQGWVQEQYGAQQTYGPTGPGGHRGKGPSGYTRSDDRIREHVCEALLDDDHVDATNIDVSVKNGEVTLSGTVDDRQQKRRAEDCIERLSGVKDVVNQLRIKTSTPAQQASGMSSASTGSSTSSSRDNGHAEHSSSEKRHRA
jgi:osmotically-inducible protein OsmY